jgi:hypothetical protein
MKISSNQPLTTSGERQYTKHNTEKSGQRYKRGN